jgi:hypothetical protein
MTELIGVMGFAILFAVFGLLRGRIQESDRGGCSSCPDDRDTCRECHMVRKTSR